MGHDVYYVRLGAMKIPVNGRMQELLGLHDTNADHVLDSSDFSTLVESKRAFADAYLGAARIAGFPCKQLNSEELTKIDYYSAYFSDAYASLMRNDCNTLVVNAHVSNVLFDKLVRDFLKGGFYAGKAYAIEVLHIFIPQDIPAELQAALREMFFKSAYVYLKTEGKQLCNGERWSTEFEDRNYLIATCSKEELSKCNFVPLLPFESEEVVLTDFDLIGAEVEY